MNLFASSNDTANQEAFGNLIAPTEKKAGFFSGIPTAAVEAVGSTINDFAMPLADAVTPMLMPGAKKIDDLFKTDVQGYLLREQQKTHDAMVNWAPDRQTVGWLGNVVYGAGNVLGDVAVGTLLTRNPLAGISTASGVQGYKGYRMGQYEGLDDATAAKMGGISAASTFIGAFLPVAATKSMAMGLTGLGMQAEVAGLRNVTAPLIYRAAGVTGAIAANPALKIASGGVLQAATGIPTRGLTSSVLEQAGYTDMAKQYEAFDAGELASDFAIGALFAGGVHGYEKMFSGKKPPDPKPSDLAAAMALNNASHIEVGTAPGIPTDTASRQAHVEAVNKTIEDMLAGRDVDVGDKVTQANFIENPVAVETRKGVVAAVEDHMGPGFQSLKIELESRGLPSDTSLYNITGKEGPREPLAPNRTMPAHLDGVVEVATPEALTRAEKAGHLTSQEAGLARWLLEKNPAIGKALAFVVKQNAGDQVGGEYNPLRKLVTIFTGGTDPLSTVHEFLHHTERMMPQNVRAGIQRAWLQEVSRLQDIAARTQNHNMIQALADVRKSNAGDDAAHERVVQMVKDGVVGPEFYALLNPSEYWAVNASKLVQARAQEGWVQKAVQWVKELIEKAKEVLGLSNTSSVIRGLDAVMKANGDMTGDVLAVGAPLRNVEAPGEGVEQKNLNGFEPDLRVKVPIDNMKLPETKTGKPDPLILTGTNLKNAARQIANIDQILAKFPDADTSPLEWSRMMAYAMATDDVPVPPYRFLKDINSDGAYKNLSRLSPGQISDAQHGFENAAAFRDAYVNKELDVETTGKLFMWSFLSRGVSPYTQEGLFIDGFKGAGQWIKKAAEGAWSESHKEIFNVGDEGTRTALADALFQADTEAYAAGKKKADKAGRPFKMEPPTRIEWDVNPDGTVNMTYSEWARTVSPKGSGQPGSGATHNLNAFGNLFLAKMSERVDGVSALQKMHDMMEDPNMTGQELRRWFISNTEGVGIDNKVVSFTLLVAGFKDVMVLDRVQIRQLWDDGRFADRNLYDGRSVNDKPVAGSALSEITYGARGLLIYEAIERALAKRIDNIYASLGRPEDASIGRYHWETWVADSQQEASHGTLDAILHDAQGNPEKIAEVTAKEGEYGAYAYGARYGRDASGTPYFLYNTPTGGEYRFTVPAFREFLDAVKLPANGVIPKPTPYKVGGKTKYKPFSVTEAGNAPWYEKAEVNKQALDALAQRYAGNTGAGEGAGAVQANGAGEAVPLQPGRGGDPYGADATIRNNPSLTYVTEDGTMISASRALAGADAEIASAKRDSQGYDAAVACALRG